MNDQEQPKTPPNGSAAAAAASLNASGNSPFSNTDDTVIIMTTPAPTNSGPEHPVSPVTEGTTTPTTLMTATTNFFRRYGPSGGSSHHDPEHTDTTKTKEELKVPKITTPTATILSNGENSAFKPIQDQDGITPLPNTAAQPFSSGRLTKSGRSRKGTVIWSNCSFI